MTLFDHQADSRLTREAPLSARMRPRTLDEFLGQDHLVGPGRVLRRSIESDQIPSMVLWGPPGSGKTTLAFLIASVTRSRFNPISAVASGVAELRNISSEAKEGLGMHGRRTILFIDEIHRFNRAQQDVILPHVEDGTLILIGATTENPSFEVNSPLLSRSRVFTLKALTQNDLERVIRLAIEDSERGLGSEMIDFGTDAMSSLVKMSDGDARIALNTLELVVNGATPDCFGIRHISVSIVEDAMQQKSVKYDKAGDQHYDTISAFIKSVRGSDPDASLYWLARMIEAGEPPTFISRRLVILAAEDVGLADPQALLIAVSAQEAVRFVGMPEGRIPLAEATLYLSTAPKSNSTYLAIDAALKDVRDKPNEPVPLHLRNAVSGLMRESGYGKGYKYSHGYEGHFAPMENMPENLRSRQYYKPSDQGYEQDVNKRLHQWWGERNRCSPGSDGGPS